MGLLAKLRLNAQVPVVSSSSYPGGAAIAYSHPWGIPDEIATSSLGVLNRTDLVTIPMTFFLDYVNSYHHRTTVI